MYIKALEQEVLRLKEVFGNTSRERDAYAEENRRLRELLAAHGISFDGLTPSTTGVPTMPPSFGGSSTGSVSGFSRQDTGSTGFSPPPLHSQTSSGAQQYGAPIPMQSMGRLPAANRIDYDQVGIDFVLTYDSQGQPVYRQPYPSPPPNQ